MEIKLIKNAIIVKKKQIKKQLILDEISSDDDEQIMILEGRSDSVATSSVKSRTLRSGATGFLAKSKITSLDKPFFKFL